LHRFRGFDDGFDAPETVFRRLCVGCLARQRKTQGILGATGDLFSLFGSALTSLRLALIVIAVIMALLIRFLGSR
jgi:hypothetical protein